MISLNLNNTDVGTTMYIMETKSNDSVKVKALLQWEINRGAKLADPLSYPNTLGDAFELRLLTYQITFNISFGHKHI